MMNSNNVYAVINSNDDIVATMDNFKDALEKAKEIGASCIETLGEDWNVEDTFWIESNDLSKQKKCAIAMIVISIIVSYIGEDITFAVCMIPIMLYLFFSRRNWIIDD